MVSGYGFSEIGGHFFITRYTICINFEIFTPAMPASFGNQPAADLPFACH